MALAKGVCPGFPGLTAVTVAGTRTYNVRNCLRITSLYIASPLERKLRLLDDREYRRRYPNDTMQGTPYWYLNRGRGAVDANNLDILKIGLYPVPDAAYTLLWDGIRPINLLVSDSDDIRLITGMPSNLVDIVIEMATAIQWKEIDDAAAATQLQEALMRLKGAWESGSHDIEDRHIMASFDEDMDYADPVLPPNYNE